MERVSQPTQAARWFRVMVIVGVAVLAGSAYLPWCTINGFTYSFFRVDSWKELPIAELVIAGAAVVAEETKLERVWLADTIAALLGDPGRLQRMSAAARSLAHPDAARDITEMAARLAGIEEVSSRAE